MIEGPWLLLNSLGCRPVSSINHRRLPQMSEAEAERFWQQLL